MKPRNHANQYLELEEGLSTDHRLAAQLSPDDHARYFPRPFPGKGAFLNRCHSPEAEADNSNTAQSQMRIALEQEKQNARAHLATLQIHEDEALAAQGLSDDEKRKIESTYSAARLAIKLESDKNMDEIRRGFVGTQPPGRELGGFNNTSFPKLTVRNISAAFASTDGSRSLQSGH